MLQLNEQLDLRLPTKGLHQNKIKYGSRVWLEIFKAVQAANFFCQKFI